MSTHLFPLKYAGLAAAMQSVNGASFISIDTETDPRLTGGKSNPHKGHVKKVMTGANVMVFQNKTVSGYNEMVKRRLSKEGKNPDSFKLSPRAWGERIPNTPFIEHNGKYYLEVIFLGSGDVHYELDGADIAKDAVIGLPAPKEEARQGGLNDKVIIRTFALDSLRNVRINHNEVKVN